MTSFGTVDAGLPCKNPSCKSNGKPHPNCKCYGTMAQGGKVDPYCSKDQMHQKDCEYYADGGTVPDEDLPDASSNSQSVPTNDLPDELNQSANVVPDSDLPDSEDKYTSPSQQALTGVEGAAQGLLGPLAIGAEVGTNKLLSIAGVPGFNDPSKTGFSLEDISARQKANPEASAAGNVAGLVGSVASGVGLPALLSQKLGSKAIGSAITSGALAGSDEISKSLLGQGDPNDAVGSAMLNMGTAALLGYGTGAALQGVSKSLSSLANTKAGAKLSDILSGFGTASQGLTLPQDASAAFNKGVKAFNVMSTGSQIAGTATGAYHGYQKDGLFGALQGALYGGTESHFAAKYAGPALAKLLSTGAIDKAGQTIDYANNIGSGLQRTTRAVNSLFGGAEEKAVTSTNAGKQLKDYIKAGGINQNLNQTMQDQNQPVPSVPQFAEGGMVPPNPIPKPSKVTPAVDPNNVLESHFPEHNLLIQSARGRISNYLKSYEPADIVPKLAYDNHPDQRDQKRKYDRAINIAVDPLSITKEIKNGTLLPDHIQHLNAMYPEVSNLLQKQITQKITEDQLSGKKAPYKIRQGLSMFMGIPLSSDMTQPNIAAAQAVFAPKQAAPQGAPAPTKNKKDSSSLSKMSNQYLTSTQANAHNAQKGD